MVARVRPRHPRRQRVVRHSRVGSWSASSFTVHRWSVSTPCVHLPDPIIRRTGPALHEERRAGERAVLGRQVRHERRDVGRIPDVEHAGVVGSLDDLAEPGRRLGEACARRRRDAVRPHAVAAELLRADLARTRRCRPSPRRSSSARGCRAAPMSTTCARCSPSRLRRPWPARASTPRPSGSGRSGPSGGR